MKALLQGRTVVCVLCAPGSPWRSRWRSCIERTRVASAAPWSSYRTAWYCCCRSRPLCPPSLAFGVSRHPSQASNRVGQRSCRRGSDGKTSGTASSRGRRHLMRGPLAPSVVKNDGGPGAWWDSQFEKRQELAQQQSRPPPWPFTQLPSQQRRCRW